MGALGSPPSFDEPYARAKLGGTFTSAIVGHDVRRSCKADGRGFTELLIAVTAGPEGARMDKQFIDYSADGRKYTLELGWTLALCGDAPEVQEVCATDG
ncbi:hypothetical protein GCM10027026_11920 [Myroides odoratimimus subsp. xuanwuensis]